MWLPLLRFLPEGFEFVLLDLPCPSDLESSARAVLQAISGVERAHFVGFSFGGAITLEMFKTSPQRFVGMSLLSFTVRSEGLRITLEEFCRRIYVGGRNTERCLKLLKEEDFRLQADLAIWDFRDVVRKVGVPVLLAYGSMDGLLNPEFVRESLSLFRDAKVSFLASSHMFPLENPRATARLLTEFWGGFKA